MRESITIQKKSFALFAGVALAATLAAGAIAPSQALASDVAWNDNVTVTAMGGNNGGYNDEGVWQAKTEAGQYDHVVMQFKKGADLAVTNDEAKAYLQENIRLANRTISENGANASNYVRPLANVVVDDDADTITFDIMANTKGTTANYSGELLINAVGESKIAEAMGNTVETIIGTGVTIGEDYNGEGVLSENKDAITFQVTNAANVRGMVHVLVMDGNTAIFDKTGTFSNGGFTVHAHQFFKQTVADFANLICTTANDISEENLLGYTFEEGTDGSFTVTKDGESCENIKAYIYDCNYLNMHQLSVGEITEDEMVNP